MGTRRRPGVGAGAVSQTCRRRWALTHGFLFSLPTGYGYARVSRRRHSPTPKGGAMGIRSFIVGLIFMLLFAGGLGAAQPVLADDTVQCATTQGTVSQNNGSSQCTATAEIESSAQSTALERSAAVAEAVLESQATAKAVSDSHAQSTALVHSTADTIAHGGSRATAEALLNSSSAADASVGGTAKSVSRWGSSAQASAFLG